MNKEDTYLGSPLTANIIDPSTDSLKLLASLTAAIVTVEAIIIEAAN